MITAKAQRTRITLTQDQWSEILWSTVGSLTSIMVALFVWKFGADWTILSLKWVASMFTRVRDTWEWIVAPLMFSAIESAGFYLQALEAKKIQAATSVGKVYEAKPPFFLKLSKGATVADWVTTAGGVYLAATAFDFFPQIFALIGVSVSSGLVASLTIATAMLVAWAVTIQPERHFVSAVRELFEVGKVLLAVTLGVR